MRDGAPARQMKSRTTPLSVSFSQDERDTVVRAAHLSDETISSFIRAAALRAAQRIAAKEQKRAA